MALGGGRIACLAIATLAVVGLYAFFATAGTFAFEHPAAGDDYRALSEAYRHGQLHLLERPDPRLATLDDPYDPGERGFIPYRWDNSYFDGKYYLYFTPLPALLVYLPWRITTGDYPSPSQVILLFSVAAWVLQSAAVLFAVRRARPGGRLVLLLAALGVANLVPYTLLRPQVYELAVMSGYLFSSAFFCCASVIWVRGPTLATCAASALCFALAVASRLSLAPLFLLLCVLAALAWRRRPEARLGFALSFAIPVAVVAAALLWHNEARFGSLFEFGHDYMLTSVDNRVHQACSPFRPIGWLRALNAGLQYLISVPTFSGVFPFVTLRPGVPLRADAAALGLTFEDVAGLLLLFPFLTLGVAALAVSAWRKGPAAVSFEGVSLLSAIGVAALVGSCWWVIVRYQLDFWPGLAIASSAGVAKALWAPKRYGRAPPVVATLALLAGVGMGALLGMSGNGDQFRSRNPLLFQRLATVLTSARLASFPQRVGCFLQPFWDIDGHRVSEVQTSSSPAMVPQRCIDSCREAGARYAAVVAASECACSDILTHRGRSRAVAVTGRISGAVVDRCRQPCSGDPTQPCGGRGYGAVFILRP